LVVDDNRLYREAILRNLEFVGYEVLEAENLRTALDEIRQRHPQVVITDLDMTHRTEGLDLIREVKVRHPLIPVILVSAVGTFEEGAEAQELGATAVISKSRIDEELENLYDCLDVVFDQISTLTSLRSRVDRVLEDFSPESASAIEEEINQLIGSIRFDNAIKGELYDWASQIKDRGFKYQGMDGVAPPEVKAGAAEEENLIEKVEEDFGPLEAFDPETETMLLAAERMMAQVGPSVDTGLARNVGFSYSFAVENEVKLRMGKKFARLAVSKELKKILNSLFDQRSQNLALGLSRYLLLNPSNAEEITPDLVRQILERMTKHGEKYKADGLKALGVIAFLFGRDYEFDDVGGKTAIKNLLGVRGLDEEEVTRLGVLLIRLQHTRNPFIHPEFSEREKLTEMRKLVADCLNLIKKIED
jgi:CheY-like chemotaxis protein